MVLLLLAAIVFACMGRRSRHRHGPWGRSAHAGPSSSDDRSGRSSFMKRFEEWHRTAHAGDHDTDSAPGSDETERV